MPMNDPQKWRAVQCCPIQRGHHLIKGLIGGLPAHIDHGLLTKTQSATG